MSLIFLLSALLALTSSQTIRSVVDRCHGTKCTLEYPVCIGYYCRSKEFVAGDIFFDIPVNRTYDVKLHLSEMFRLDDHGYLQKIVLETPFMVKYYEKYSGELLVLITTRGMKFVLHYHGESRNSLLPTTMVARELTTPTCPPKPTSSIYYGYVALIFGGIILTYLLYRVGRWTFTRQRADRDIVLVNMDGVNETLL